MKCHIKLLTGFFVKKGHLIDYICRRRQSSTGILPSRVNLGGILTGNSLSMMYFK